MIIIFMVACVAVFVAGMVAVLRERTQEIACPCNVCTRYRVYGTYAAVFAFSVACGTTFGALL